MGIDKSQINRSLFKLSYKKRTHKHTQDDTLKFTFTMMIKRVTNGEKEISPDFEAEVFLSEGERENFMKRENLLVNMKKSKEKTFRI